MELKSEILSLLRNSQDYISGQELCDKFQVSRTAIWKNINSLKEEGYDIQAVRNRGYLLREPSDVLNEQEIKRYLHTRYMAGNIVFEREMDSTNIRARQAYKENMPHGTLVITEKQTAGRGRRGRVWDSPQGGSIYMTLLLKPDIHPADASTMTLVMVLSLAKAVKDLYGLPEGEEGVQIKWPNDLVLHKKKITGILTEMSADMDQVYFVIIGVGINVNLTEFSQEIKDKASSLRLETGLCLPRAKVVAKAMEYFEADYEKFMESHTMKGLKEDYEKFLVNMDASVRVLDPKGEYTGIARGINEKGELLVEREGEIILVYSGEVSVRGIYGYV